MRQMNYIRNESKRKENRKEGKIQISVKSFMKYLIFFFSLAYVNHKYSMKIIYIY